MWRFRRRPAAVVASLARGLGVGSPLVGYGIGDIVTDLMFNTAGGLVVIWGASHFDSLVPFGREAGNES